MVEKIDFTKSGATNEARQYAETITLEMCKHTAKACGFITTGEDKNPVNASGSDEEAWQQRAKRKKQTDLNQFFFTLGVASLSGLRRRFYSEKLPEPFPGLTPLLHDRDKPKIERVTWTIPDVSEYDNLAAKWESLRWRLIPKPGGAVTKPDDWYKLWAAVQQVTTGDVPGEKPLWAKTGGLDFDGRDRWEAHKSLKGQSTEEAKLTFVQAWGRANSKERERINFRPT